MRFFALVFCFFTAIPVVSAPQYEPDSKANDFIFYMPRGWNRVDRPDATMLVAPLTSPSVAYIVLLPPFDLAPDLPGVFDRQWQGVQKDYRVVQGGQVTSQHFPKGYDAKVTTAVLSDRNNHAWVFYLMVAQNGNHAEQLFFLSNVGNPQTLLEVLQHVIDSIGFSGGAGDPMAAAASKPVGLPKGKGNLNGLYRGVGIVHYAEFGKKPGISWSYHVFFPDGRFKEGFPELGLDNLDEDAEIRRNPVGWGTYDPSGGPDGHGKIVFMITDPVHEKEPIVWDFKEYPDHVDIRGTSYNLLERCDGMRLEGTFRRADYKTLYAGGQKGIAFTRDGQFVDEGAFAAASVLVRQPVGIGEDFDDGKPGRGTYRIANYTLTLTFSDGRVKRTSIFREPGAPKGNVDEFYLNTYKFARVQ